MFAECRKETEMIDSIGSPITSPGPSASEAALKDKAMREAANEFEAVFLAEMLSHTSLGDTSETFGGGAGEDAFGSLMTREWANQLTARGGIGLSETIYQALVARGGGDV